MRRLLSKGTKIGTRRTIEIASRDLVDGLGNEFK